MKGHINIQNNKILDQAKMKAFADEKTNVTENLKDHLQMLSI